MHMDTLLLTKKKMIASSYTWYTMMTILSLLMLYNANLFFKGQAEQGSNIIYCKYYNQANMAAVLYQAIRPTRPTLPAAGGINKTKKEDVTGEKSR